MSGGRVLGCDLQAHGGKNSMTAKLVPTELGASSCQEMKMLATWAQQGPQVDSKAGSASSSGHLSLVSALPTAWGQALSLRVKGTKQGVEGWKPGTEVLGDLISMCETKRAWSGKPFWKCEELRLLFENSHFPGMDKPRER